MLTSNTRTSRSPYPNDLKQILNIEAARESRSWLSHWRLLRADATPLWRMPGTAAQVQLAHLSIKDESVRSQLGSFRALGAPIALVRFIFRQWPEHQLEAGAVLNGGYRDLLANLPVISATDGTMVGRWRQRNRASAASVSSCCTAR
ncbi:MAG: hypothetical protein M3R24_17110 [Chloroflexota bacterium]|nr:hypothetical protein [Chloroflexota bacterium]